MHSTIFVSLAQQADDIGARIIGMTEERDRVCGAIVLEYDFSPKFGTARWAMNDDSKGATLFCHDRYYERSDAFICAGLYTPDA